MEEKPCSKCGTVKPLSDFTKKSSLKLGVSSQCRECERERHALYRALHPEKKKESAAAWRSENAVAKREYDVAWKASNPENMKEMSRRAYRKWVSTAKGRLEHNMSGAVRIGLLKGSKNGSRTFDLLDYSADELRAHLERQFKPGMNWDNYGEWHIDHKTPRAAFNYETPQDIDFKRCWALSNLQPMWAFDNLSKGAKMDKPFQPSLAIAA